MSVTTPHYGAVGVIGTLECRYMLTVLASGTRFFSFLDVFLRFPFLTSGLLKVFYPGFMRSGIRVYISLPYVRVRTLHEVFHLAHVTDYTMI